MVFRGPYYYWGSGGWYPNLLGLRLPTRPRSSPRLTLAQVEAAIGAGLPLRGCRPKNYLLAIKQTFFSFPLLIPLHNITHKVDHQCLSYTYLADTYRKSHFHDYTIEGSTAACLVQVYVRHISHFAAWEQNDRTITSAFAPVFSLTRIDPSIIKLVPPRGDLYNYFYLDFQYDNELSFPGLAVSHFSRPLINFLRCVIGNDFFKRNPEYLVPHFFRFCMTLRLFLRKSVMFLFQNWLGKT
ncbi:uncharacterized protein EDB91DRAFT_1102452 [Suillus paluster]|uniref:uncharacterized protein n=1 Tax=Suillus paluster TaxID=48578 RepID=UPI001B87B687|nr:uncharacterized protein EDB91DRAFT_1102452 [Suillus paluster]KAG1752421.1 hypothetical protein EDB91DRAFT_1102452 [Suillus paluster]